MSSQGLTPSLKVPASPQVATLTSERGSPPPPFLGQHRALGSCKGSQRSSSRPHLHIALSYTIPDRWLSSPPLQTSSEGKPPSLQPLTWPARTTVQKSPLPLCPSRCSRYFNLRQQTLLSALLFSTGVWVLGIWLRRQMLKLLLSYHGWMFEPHGKTSFSTKVWVVRPRGPRAAPSLAGEGKPRPSAPSGSPQGEGAGPGARAWWARAHPLPA